MTDSPGHRKWPEHQVLEEDIADRLLIVFNGEIVANSANIVKVTEDGHPDRYYIPRKDLRMDLLTRDKNVTECPFKGIAHYYTLKVGDREAANAAWTYEDPYVQHRGLKNLLAFYPEKVDEFILQPSSFAKVL